jgi:hypothetical protein
VGKIPWAYFTDWGKGYLGVASVKETKQKMHSKPIKKVVFFIFLPCYIEKNDLRISKYTALRGISLKKDWRIYSLTATMSA